MKSKRTSQRPQRMGWKKLLSDPPGDFECLPGKVRAWATLLYRYAYADGTIRCRANPNALAMLARVHMEERKHWPRIVRDLEAAGVLLCCKDEDCWRLKMPDSLYNEDAIIREDRDPMSYEWQTAPPLEKPLAVVRQTFGGTLEDVWRYFGGTLEGLKHAESLDPKSTDKRREEKSRLEKRETPTYPPSEQLALDGSSATPRKSPPAICVSALEQLVLDSFNESQLDPRRRVRWNRLRLTWFRRAMADEGHSPQEAVAIVLGWPYVPWVERTEATAFETIWSPKLASCRSEAIVLGTYNPEREYAMESIRLSGRRRPLTVGDPLGAEQYRFGATLEDHIDVLKRVYGPRLESLAQEHRERWPQLGPAGVPLRLVGPDEGF